MPSVQPVVDLPAEPASRPGCGAAGGVVPGRLRLPVPRLYRNRARAERLTVALGAVPGVIAASANPLTGRALVWFDAQRLSHDEVHRLVLAAAGTPALGAAAAPGPVHGGIAAAAASRRAGRREVAAAAEPERRPAASGAGPGAEALQVLATGSILGGVALKRWLLGPGAIAGSLRAWDLAGLTAAVAGYPFLRRGVSALARGRWSGDLLLGAAGLTALVLRENLLGLSVLWLGSLTRLIQAASADRMRRRLGVAAGPALPAPQAGCCDRAALGAASEAAVARLVPVALGAAALAALAGGGRRALAVLVAGCPAAAALVGATVAAAGSAGAARRGLLLTRPDALATAGAVDTVLFDEPGALWSDGAAVVEAVPLAPNLAGEDVLRLLAAAGSADALARAVSGLPWSPVTDPEVRAGGRRFVLGDATPTRRGSAEATRLEQQGCAVVWVARAERPVGLVGLRQALRPGALAAVEVLRCSGVERLGIVSSAGAAAVHPLAAALGVPHTYAGTEPREKRALIRRLQAEGRCVAVVGRNPALLAAADLGIALAPGAGGGALAGDGDPRQAASLIAWGRQVNAVARQGAILGTGAAAAGLVLAATGVIGPLGATAVQNLACLAVLLNAARLYAGPRTLRRPGLQMAPVAATGGEAGSGHLRVLPGGKAPAARDGSAAGRADVAGDGPAPGRGSAPPAGAAAGAGARTLAALPGACAAPVETPAVTPVAHGLSSAEVASRLAQYGPNALPAPRRTSLLRRLVDQLKETMVYVLMAGAGLAFLAGRRRDAATILAVVGVNALIGAMQTGRTDGSLDALRRLAAPDTTVRRDGRALQVPVAQVVPGDVVLLQPGDRVPADGFLLSAENLAVDEALLTGESVPVYKEAAPAGHGRPLGLGAATWVYAGTGVARGRGELQVVSTGARTEMGRIAALMQGGGPAFTPLQRRMHELGNFLLKGALVVCGAVAVAGLLRGQPLLEVLLGGVSLAVAAIPEGLPTFVTLGLAAGVQKLAERRAMVRRLAAVETLGCATVVCTDKTGTLTRGEMTVRAAWAGDKAWRITGTGYDPAGAYHRGVERIDPRQDPDLHQLLVTGTLCNDARLSHAPEGWRVLGDTTEGALLVAAAKAGLDPAALQAGGHRLAELPFEASRRRMAVLCARADGQPVACVKGAAEAVLAVCDRWLREGCTWPLTAARRRRILAAADAMAAQALRVLALAYKPAAAGDDLEQGLIFAGLVGMSDPPRPETAPALAHCREAGIGVIMLTGDHPATATAVAREIGLLAAGETVLSGEELAALDDAALQALAPRLRVVARASPEQKLRVVRALQQRGDVVAMTGDGVNDAPAVKAADIGIAMGRGGTEVTRQAADVVLADDNFATIVAAVEQGRASYDNIRKAVRYLLASNTGEVGLMLAAALLGLPAPLTAAQLLWLNAVGDGLPAVALMTEPPDSRTMQQPPRPPAESVFAGGLQRRILGQGAQMGLAGLGLFAGALALGRPLPTARTMALAGLASGQFIHAFQCREPLDGRGKAGPLRAGTVAAVGGAAALLVGSLHWPALAGAFGLVPLGLADWGLVLGAAALGCLRLPSLGSAPVRLRDRRAVAAPLPSAIT